MRTTIIALALAASLAACGSRPTEQGAAANASAGADPPNADATAAVSVNAPLAAPATALASRTRELTNPDQFTMVLLYYSVSGLSPPIDKWVEADMDLRIAKPEDKPKARDAARARISAGLAAVKDVGILRLTAGADLSDYDPGYGEYAVRAFAPSSSLVFEQFGEKVLVTFDNAQKAQRWSVPQTEVQAIKDKIRYNSDVSVDARLRITGAAPDANGGTITTSVLDYELKEGSTGTTIARVTVPG